MDQKPNAAEPEKPLHRPFQFSLRTLMLAVTIISVAVGGWFCWERHLEAVRIAEEANVREVAFRDMLSESSSHEFERYLAFGLNGLNPAVPIDPPAGYVDRFNDIGVRIRPASLARFPKNGEVDGDGFRRNVEDPVTGVQGRVFVVRIARWIDDHTVEVEADEYSESLNGCGYRATLEKRDGQWQITKKTDEWVS